MNSPNSSSLATLNLFTIFLGIIGIILGIVDGFPNPGEWEDYIPATIIILASMVLAIIVNWKSFSKFIYKRIEHVKILNSVIFERIHGRLIFLSPYGEDVVYSEECLIKRIKRRFIYEGNVKCFSTKKQKCHISTDIQTFNCYNSINNKKDTVTIVYGRKRNTVNGDNYSMINRRQLQFGFAVEMKNAFTQEVESWASNFKHYTKEFVLQLRFDPKNPPKWVDILQLEVDENGNKEFKSLPTDPLIVDNKDEVLVKFVLLHIKKGSVLKVEWEWDKKKSPKKEKTKK